MPYVDGESLRDTLDRERQLPVDESIRIAVAIASALDYAHKRGVIHRDLKPENILLQSRQPMVADFGIALAVSRAGGARITQTGLSLGTPQYMSPEQATGDRVIDGRTDIYSLGAMLYEMLTGDPPHLGSTAQAIIAKVITEKPPHVRIARDTIPAHVDAAIDRALAKLPADRFATAGEFADALLGRGHPSSGANTAHDSRSTPATWRARARSAAPWLAVILVTAALGVWGSLLRARPVPRGPVRFLLNLPLEDRITQGMALSPDGSTLVYAGDKLVVRPLSQLESYPLPGTGGASGPFFSPDGRWVGFLASGKLKKVAIAGGAPIVIVESMTSVTAAAWGPGDVIAWQPNGKGLAYTARNDTTGEDLMLVPADGSADARPVFRRRGDQYDQSWTPDGQTLVYLDDDPIQGIWLSRIDGGKPVKWLSGGGANLGGPRVSPDGHWLAYSSTLSGRAEVYVRSFPTPAGVVRISAGGGSEPVWSRDGHTLYYRQDDKLMEAALVTTPEFTVTGRHLILTQRFLSDGNHTNYDVSPDGKTFVFLKYNEADAHIVVVVDWLAELRQKLGKP